MSDNASKFGCRPPSLAKIRNESVRISFDLTFFKKPAAVWLAVRSMVNEVRLGQMPMSTSLCMTESHSKESQHC